MIIGNGMLAKAFESFHKRTYNYIIFASGVSNSNETSFENFNREKELLLEVLEQYKDKTIVYFSSCSIYDSSLTNSLYVYHKMCMERLVRENSKNYLIARLPQVIGKTYSPTIVNFLFNKIKNRECFSIFGKAHRNFIDVDDVVKVTNYLLKEGLFINSLVNLASTHHTSMYELILYLEKISNQRAFYNVENKGSRYFIDVSILQDVYQKLGIKFDKDYVEKVINKYYAIK